MDENNNNGNFNFGPNNFGNQGFDTNPLGNIPNDPFAGQTNNIPQNGFDNFGSAPVAPQEPVIENPVTPNVEPAPAPIIEEPITKLLYRLPSIVIAITMMTYVMWIRKSNSHKHRFGVLIGAATGPNTIERKTPLRNISANSASE